MRVHPLYDIDEKVWVTESGIAAATLRELKPLLPEGTEIEGYYPNGGPTINRGGWGPVETSRSHLRTNYAPSTSVQQRVALRVRQREEDKLARQKAEYDAIQEKAKKQAQVKAAIAAVGELTPEQRYEKVLDLRALHMNTYQIAKSTGIHRNTVERLILRGAESNDARALVKPHRVNAKTEIPRKPPRQVVVYNEPRDERWTDERLRLLRQLAALQLSAGEIAARLPGAFTRNGVIGKCNRLGIQLHGKGGNPYNGMFSRVGS